MHQVRYGPAEVASLLAYERRRTRRRILRRYGLAFGTAATALGAAILSRFAELPSLTLPHAWMSPGSSRPATATGSELKLTGTASVIDGDTIELQRVRIRLFGVDAPESSQVCQDAGGRNYRCGQQSALALADRIGSATVICEAGSHDRYGRLIAVCTASGEELNRWMVMQGWAVAYRRYSQAYAGAETDARANRRGIWAARFDMPWTWRKNARQSSPAS